MVKSGMEPLDTIRVKTDSLTARVLWMRITFAGALILTLFDALLLQKTKAFFTGGFLSPVFTSGPLEALVFISLSTLADAGLMGIGVAVALWATARVRLTMAARTLAVLLTALFPPLLMDFVSYRLFAYLGDAFDLVLMFELTGRRPGEIAAVALPHMLQLAGLVIAGAAGLVALVWIVNRYSGGAVGPVNRPIRRLAVPALLLFGVAMIGSLALSARQETLDYGLGRKPSGRVFETIVGTLTDFDRDGFGVVGGMRDVDPFNAAAYPWAVDLPGNGVDENGVGGDLPAESLPYIEGTRLATAWKHRPDVVLFVLESFRADVVGKRINGQPVTPVLDGLARQGVSSSHAYSHNGYTAQSRFHLLTGSLAGLRRGSLIDDFNANGYETAYFSAQDESFGAEALSVGFERAHIAYDARQDRGLRYSTFSTPGSLAISFLTVQERIASFLANRDGRRPLFLYVNFHDTHYPYHHAQIAPLVSPIVLPQSRIAPPQQHALQEMYFNTAANVDRAIGRVVEAVTGAVRRSPAVIVTADHGESLFDGNFLGHGYALNEVQTRIPLIVQGLPVRIVEPFGQSDLRDAIGAAMCLDPVLADGPAVVAERATDVFQYLGNIDRPRQIALLNTDGRLIFDFRTRQVLSPGAEVWRGEHSLGATEQARLLALIHTWERMMLARARG